MIQRYLQEVLALAPNGVNRYRRAESAHVVYTLEIFFDAQKGCGLLPLISCGRDSRFTWMFSRWESSEANILDEMFNVRSKSSKWAYIYCFHNFRVPCFPWIVRFHPVDSIFLGCPDIRAANYSWNHGLWNLTESITNTPMNEPWFHQNEWVVRYGSCLWNRRNAVNSRIR